MNAICRKRLYNLLGFKNSIIPKELTTTFNNIPLLDDKGVILLYTNIFIRKSSGRNYHRVLAYCPNCGEYIPVGRFHQHHGSQRCLDANS